MIKIGNLSDIPQKKKIVYGRVSHVLESFLKEKCLNFFGILPIFLGGISQLNSCYFAITMRILCVGSHSRLPVKTCFDFCRITRQKSEILDKNFSFGCFCFRDFFGLEITNSTRKWKRTKNIFLYF